MSTRTPPDQDAVIGIILTAIIFIAAVTSGAIVVAIITGLVALALA